MEAVFVALIVAGVGVFGQWLLRKQDFRRQDEVAARQERAAERAEEATRSAARKAEEAATLLVASNVEIGRQAALAAEATHQQLSEIHTLVNANLTNAQQRELQATVDMLVTMREVVSLKRQMGIPVAPDTDATLHEIQERIDNLSRDVTHKVEQTDRLQEK